MDKKEMIQLRLDGKTYEEIAQRAGVSRQRIQQIISPPKAIREYVVDKYNGQCADCGIHVGKSGHVHHDDLNGIDDFNDIESLVLLCNSCHRRRHHREPGLLNLSQAANELGVSRPTIYAMVKRGELHLTRIADRGFISEEGVRIFKDSRKNQSMGS